MAKEKSQLLYGIWVHVKMMCKKEFKKQTLVLKKNKILKSWPGQFFTAFIISLHSIEF